MPRRKQKLPAEILELVDNVNKGVKDENNTDKRQKESKLKKYGKKANTLKEVNLERQNKEDIVWDIPQDQEILFFDTNLSYEITGYRPINESKGLDFNPEWFIETRDTYLRTGHYCSFPRGTKAFGDFWREQYRRCRDGMKVNGYTITGDHYFFLNFYQLKDLVNTTKAGGGRSDIFPDFLVMQYEWFHYVELARRTRTNAGLLKAREIGFSEMEAAIVVNSYNTIRSSINVCCAYSEFYLTKLLEKVWGGLTFLNNCTDGGFFKSRLVMDSQYLKRASLYKMENGLRNEVGWKSQILGIIGDKPYKLAGDRTDLLLIDEAGLFYNLAKTYTVSDALVGLIGLQWGIRIIGGSSGDSGPLVEGLRNMYYNPQVFGILPFRHHYTQTKEEAITAFFIPAFKVTKNKKYLDERGFISEAFGKELCDRDRAIRATDPRVLVDYCSQYCYNAEEAFSLEGDNKFNKINIAEQLTLIRALKRCPKIERGYIEYLYKDGVHLESNISGFKWIPNEAGNVQILEHPLWTLQEQHDEKGDVTWRPPTLPIRDLYVIGIDGIDIGSALTSEVTKDPSDFCLTVYRRVYGMKEPQFVALYKDRPRDVRECYKVAIKLALYYNAVINIEATRLGIIPYARERNVLRLFMKRPRATLSDTMRNNNKQFGTPATAAIIDHLTDLIANYVEDYCHMIWFDEMLDELNRYSNDNKNKFDIIAAMAMALLADEELLGVVPRNMQREEDKWEDIGYYTDSEGRRRYGIIPLTQQLVTNGNISTYYEDFGPRTSDPRLYHGFV